MEHCFTVCPKCANLLTALPAGMEYYCNKCNTKLSVVDLMLSKKVIAPSNLNLQPEIKKQEIIDMHFIRLAWMTALNLSKDPVTAVGSCVVSADTKQITTGYNGFPTGMKETKELWQRPNKYPRVTHAEINSLLNCPFDTKGTTLYCTHRPCHRCICYIVNTGVKRVVYNEDYINEQDENVWNEVASLFDEVRKIEDDEFLKLLKSKKEEFRLSNHFRG